MARAHSGGWVSGQRGGHPGVGGGQVEGAAAGGWRPTAPGGLRPRPQLPLLPARSLQQLGLHHRPAAARPRQLPRQGRSGPLHITI